MDDDRIFGCLPGETPTSIVLLQQERRHHEALAAAQSRIAELERLHLAESRDAERRCVNVEQNFRAIVEKLERLLAAALDVIETPYYDMSLEQSDACREIRDYLAAVEKAMGGA